MATVNERKDGQHESPSEESILVPYRFAIYNPASETSPDPAVTLSVRTLRQFILNDADGKFEISLATRIICIEYCNKNYSQLIARVTCGIGEFDEVMAEMNEHVLNVVESHDYLKASPDADSTASLLRPLRMADSATNRLADERAEAWKAKGRQLRVHDSCDEGGSSLFQNEYQFTLGGAGVQTEAT